MPTTTLTTIFQHAIAVADTDELMYTCPASTTVQIPGVNVCNRGGAATFRLWKVLSGGSTEAKQYKAYDQAIAANMPFYSSAYTLNAGDKLYGRANSNTMTFGADGAVMT